MMFLIWLPIILIVIISITGSVYYFKKREFFLEHKSFIGFWGIILSILFALFAFLKTQSSMESSTQDFGNIVTRMDAIISKAKESSESLNNVDESLSKLPQQLDAFSESIKSFDDVISSQRDQLSATLNGLNNSILTFKSSIDSMIERFNRKPELDIDLLSFLTDTARIINNIVITNRGKLLSDVYRIRFLVDTNFVK
jgi:peptidoglycan hydrolase CwlO-like protein